MKALTVQQPFASLICQGIKDVENRSWRTNFRGTIYIHAAAKLGKLNFDYPETNHEIIISTMLNQVE